MYYFSIDSCTELYFAVLMQIGLIPYWCLSCCWAYPFIQQTGILIIQGDQVSKTGLALDEPMLAMTDKGNLLQQQPKQSSPLLFQGLRLDGQVCSFPDLPSCHIPTLPLVGCWDESIYNICWFLWNSEVNLSKLHGLMTIRTLTISVSTKRKCLLF